jgi:hypothetical protein
MVVRRRRQTGAKKERLRKLPQPLGTDNRESSELAFALLKPVGVDLNKVFPLVWSRGLLENRFDGADRFASAAVDALFRVDIELVFLLEFFGLVFGRMDAIDRTDIDAGGIFDVYARLSNDIGHLTPPQGNF